MIARIALVISLVINCGLAAYIYMNRPTSNNAKAEKIKKEFLQPDTSAMVKVDFSGAEELTVTYDKLEIDEHLKNLPRVLRDAKAVPYIQPDSGGEIKGFKIVTIKPNSVYTKMGIQNGDVIMGVNGTAINSPKKAMQIYQSLKKGRLLNLQILRGGQRRVLNYAAE